MRSPLSVWCEITGSGLSFFTLFLQFFYMRMMMDFTWISYTKCQKVTVQGRSKQNRADCKKMIAEYDLHGFLEHICEATG